MQLPEHVKGLMKKIIIEGYKENIKSILKEKRGQDISDWEADDKTYQLIEQDKRRGVNPLMRAWGGFYTPGSIKYDDQKRIIWHTWGSIVTENIYSDDPNAYPTATDYDLSDQAVQEQRPDLVEWVKSVRQKELEQEKQERSNKRKKKEAAKNQEENDATE